MGYTIWPDGLDGDAIRDIWREFQKARERFAAFNSAHEGYAVLAEEVDELWDLVKGKRNPENAALMRKEAIQVGAMALAFIVECCDVVAPADAASGKTGGAR
jgi:hypothetical protein